MVPKICAVDGCETPIGAKGARGWCTRHYQMWRLTGDPAGSTAPTASQRFWKKVLKTDACWNWTASKDGSGYGMFKFQGASPRAHRWAYESLIGPIPRGLQLDHLCRNRACVNPSHLEPVTRHENLERGWGRRVKTGWVNSCVNGHEYTPQNTYQNPKGALVCRACSAESRRKYERKMAA